MMTIEQTTRIERPVEEVWAFTHDLTKSPL